MQKKSNQSIKSVISNNWFIFSYVYKTVPLYTFKIIFFAVFFAMLNFFEFTYMIMYMTDCIQYHKPFSYPLTYIVLLFITLCFWLWLSSSFAENWMKVLTIKLNKAMQLDIYSKAVSMDLECYDDPQFYNDFVWAMSESTKRTEEVMKTIGSLIDSITRIISAGVFVIFFDKMGLIFLAISVVLSFAGNITLNKLRYKMNIESRPISRKRDYINRVFYLNDYTKEIRLSNIKEKLYKEFDKSNAELEEVINRYSIKLTIFTFLQKYVYSYFLINGLYVLYLLYKVVVVSTLSYGAIFGLLRAIWTLQRNLGDFTDAIPKFQENSLYIEKIKCFLNYEPKIKNVKNPLPLQGETGILEFKNVSFSYQKGGSTVLNKINLSVKPGSKIAIVGPNGAGKSTLTKLIMRLYDVSEGEILYGGKNIKEYDTEAYRGIFGSVFQDYQLFAASLSENVAMSSEVVREEQIKDALEKAGFADKLSLLKNGTETSLTREFDENGIGLSGGESQKIAIARVLFKNSKFIVLDEPSSALDPISEYHLNETITKVAKDKTIIFISHRLSTTRMCDEIYMVENGEILELGSHEELMAQDGKYAYMFNLQAEKYRTAAKISVLVEGGLVK